jgi:hypothetical protein
MKKGKKQEHEPLAIPSTTEQALATSEAVQNDHASQPLEEKAAEQNQEKDKEEKKAEMPRQTFGQILRRLVLATLRLILIVILIGGGGMLIYYGVPFVYDTLIRPVEQNTSQITNLDLRQRQLEFEVMDLQTQIATLEAGQTSQSDVLAENASAIQTLTAAQIAQSGQIATLENADAERNDTLADLTYQSGLLRAMELLSRARLFLYQSNYGLARSDVQAARDILAEMQTSAPASKQAGLSEAIFRLDLALKNLPEFPVAASDDLDIAWQILLAGYPIIPPTPAPTATLLPTATVPPAATP